MYSDEGMATLNTQYSYSFSDLEEEDGGTSDETLTETPDGNDFGNPHRRSAIELYCFKGVHN